MSYRRKLNEYRTILDNAHVSASAVIPHCTWRRWLHQGKITEERLLELGINPRKRKRQRTKKTTAAATLQKSEVPSVLSVSQESSSNLSDDSTQMPSKYQPSSTSHEDSSVSSEVNGDLPSDISSLENDQGSLLNGSISLDGTDVSSQSHIIDSDPSHENDFMNIDLRSKHLSSILESKKNGVETLNEPLTAGMTVTKFETLLMIFHLGLRHGLKDELLEDLMSFVNELVGDPSAIPASKYLFHKLFMFGSEPTVHFFCPDCDIYLGPKGLFTENFVCCTTCNWSESVSSLNDNNYFVTLSVKDQLQTVLSRPNTNLLQRKNNVAQRKVLDMFDGQIYQKLMKDPEVLSNENALTISISSDGSPVFKNGSNTLYPIYFHLNEMPAQERFDAENILLAGLWFSKKGEPNMQTFLKPLVTELQCLGKEGIVWKRQNGSVVQSPIYLTCVCADSVARPKILNFMQFNGSFGCSYCMHPNTSISVNKPLKKKGPVQIVLGKKIGNSSDDDDSSDEPNQHQIIRQQKVMRYLAEKTFKLRTDKEVRNHMKLAEDSPLDHIYGTKGVSVLCALPSLNMVFGIPIDYMHAILLGVMKRLASLWFDCSSNGKPYYIGLKVDIVNARLNQISTPSSMTRPRSMSERKHWKAKEWRNFLLYYGLPCLLSILNENYYNHFKKLVTAIHIFTRDVIHYDEAEEGDKLLNEFVYEYQTLYGEINMVYNVHLTSHLGRQVAKMGPLWSYSLFHFESANGRLVKLTKGTQGVALQIARKYLMTLTVTKLLQTNYKVKDSVLKFCSKVVEYKYSKNSFKCGNVTLTGRPLLLDLTTDQKTALEINDIYIGSVFVKVHYRAFYNGVCYSSRQLEQQRAFNDSCVRLIDGSFVFIDLIVALNRENNESNLWCIGTKLNIATNITNLMPPHVKQCALDSFGSLVSFCFSKIARKCVFISISGKNFVAELPNTIEKS